MAFAQFKTLAQERTHVAWTAYE